MFDLHSEAGRTGVPGVPTSTLIANVRAPCWRRVLATLTVIGHLLAVPQVFTTNFSLLRRLVSKYEQEIFFPQIPHSSRKLGKIFDRNK
jgi:hypothetical protein